MTEYYANWPFDQQGTITYELRHDYIPAKDGDDA